MSNPALLARTESIGAGAPEEEIEITPEMVEAGLEAADLLSFRFGYTAPVPLVSRVYRAMYAAAQKRCLRSR